jgi:predicted neutral ceramidase superfamily lipid hydrolase
MQAAAEAVIWFSPRQIGWATFFGSPIATGLPLRANARAAADEDGERLAIAVGSIGTALLLVLAFVLPDDFPGSLLSIINAVTAHTIAKMQWSQQQQAHGAPHVQATGRAIRVTLVSFVLAIALAIVIVFVGAMLFPDAALWGP